MCQNMNYLVLMSQNKHASYKGRKKYSSVELCFILCNFF